MGSLLFYNRKNFTTSSPHSKLDIPIQCYCRLLIFPPISSPWVTESHSFIPHPHCYVHGAQVCHQMCFLKACVSAHVDAGTAGPHSRILPTTPSLQVAREVSPLERRSSSHSWLPLQALKAFSDEILVSQKVLSILSGHTALRINIIKVTS